MNFSYDADADAAYVSLTAIAPGAVDETVCVSEGFPALAGDVNLDLDGDGRLLGIEILGASRFLPTDLLQ
jgi:uncharacterized protein YuzE